MALARSVPLSVLDLAPVVSGSTPRQALQNSLDLARNTERWGYTRYWLAEHHNMPGIASSSPAVLIGEVAAATSTIRVGSGGVMLPNHPPLVVAEQFGTLETFHPGRIDLGIGRAPGTDQVTAHALRRSADPLSAEDFPQQLGELMAFLSGKFPDDHPYQAVRAVPRAEVPVPIWLLGSSGYSAQVAGLLGLPFAFAHHFSAENTLPAMELYHERFTPGTLQTPYAMICANVLLAETDERAQELARGQALQYLRTRTGRRGRFPSPQDVAENPLTEEEQAFVAPRMANNIVGGPETVAARIDDLLAQTQADELMVTTQVWDYADRRESYRLLAELGGLTARSAEASPDASQQASQQAPAAG